MKLEDVQHYVISKDKELTLDINFCSDVITSVVGRLNLLKQDSHSSLIDFVALVRRVDFVWHTLIEQPRSEIETSQEFSALRKNLRTAEANYTSLREGLLAGCSNPTSPKNIKRENVDDKTKPKEQYEPQEQQQHFSD